MTTHDHLMNLKHFLTNKLELFLLLYAEKFVPLQCRNKDGTRCLGQPKFRFRPARFYGLPSAQKFRPEIDNEC